MVSLRRLAIASLLAALPLHGCSCGEEAGHTGDEDSAVDNDGGPSDNDGGPSDNDGGPSGNDGGPSENDGGPSENDGGPNDGGNPLDQPLSDFCRGQGTVVEVGAGASCAGTIAEDTFRLALCTCDTASAQSNLLIDAFDSRLGTYGATTAAGVNVSDDGHLGVNGMLNLGGKVEVRGAAYVGGGGFSVGPQSVISRTLYANGPAVQANSVTAIGRNAYINGDVSGRFEIAGDLQVPPTATVSAQTASNVGGSIVRRAVPTVAPCACAADEILDIAALTDFGRTHNDNAVGAVLTSTAYQSGGPGTLVLPCGRYYLTRVEQPGGLQIRALGRTVLFVDGDMHIGGGFDLALDPGAEVDLFVRGSLTIGAAARLGDRSQPSKVRTYVGGTEPIVLGASALFGGNLYAPRADVTFSASASLFGALFARSAHFSGSAAVHFDSAVRAAGASCSTPDGGPADAGTGPADAGTGPADAGTGPADAGNGPADAGNGPATCSGCGECGNLACIIPAGEATGVCTACSSDLDCCAPDLCVAGVCTLSL